MRSWRGWVVEVGTLSAKTTRGILDVLAVIGRDKWMVAMMTIDKNPGAKSSWRARCGDHLIPSRFHGGLCSSAMVQLESHAVLWAFVDGCHCQDCVADDISAIVPLMPVGGEICFHDADRQRELGMLVHERYHGDGRARSYGWREATIESPEMALCDLVEEVPAMLRPPGAPTPIFGGVRRFRKMRLKIDG